MMALLIPKRMQVNSAVAVVVTLVDAAVEYIIHVISA